MVKQTVVNPKHGILLSIKKECESPGNYAEWKKSIPKDYRLYDFTYVTYLK